MLPYWLFFLVPAIAALAVGPRNKLTRFGTRPFLPNATWIMVIITLTILIGFRYEVGGDWYNYFRYLREAAFFTFSDAILRSDPGFWVLNVFSLQMGWGIQGVNTIGGLIFSTGLVVFCRTLPRPWLALAVAIPYLFIVVAMGYSRQSIALGFAMMGFVALPRGAFIWFLAFVLLGASFHKSAVLLIPLATMMLTQNRFFAAGIILATSALAYQVLLEDSAESLIVTYVDEQQQSQGAIFRLGLNAMAGGLFLHFRNRLRITRSEYIQWRLYSLLATAMFVALFLTPLSTALDRLGLYILPLQIFVFSHLPDILGRYGRRNDTIVAGILVYYASTLFIWLNFGTFSKLWLPFSMQF